MAIRLNGGTPQASSSCTSTTANVDIGKTAPRLIQDLDAYNPHLRNGDLSNDLTHAYFNDAEEDDEHPPLPSAACRHQWAIKGNQSVMPESDSDLSALPDNWTFACCCTRCRNHLDFQVDYGLQDQYSRPCPGQDRPLHHFVFKPGVPTVDSDEVNGEACGVAPSNFACNFVCSNNSCNTSIKIEFRPPRLKNDWISLLTDKVIIKARVDRAISNDPERFQGHATPLPGSVLETLFRLLRIALTADDDDPSKKSYPRDGKSWLLNFGEESASLLEYLGFTSDVITSSELHFCESNTFQGGPWQWPKLDSSAQTPYQDPHRILLDDVREEIYTLMMARPGDERRSASFKYSPTMAQMGLRAALGCAEYKVNSRSRAVDLTIDEHPAYAGIGAVADFHDDLVFFAYNRQISTDQENTPYYLQCLQVIAEGRESEDLGTKAVVEESKGHLSLGDVKQAYRNLGQNLHDKNLADDTIIGSFQARLSDAPKQETLLRRDLGIIGKHRRSYKIQNMATQAVSNYEQALGFLDTEESTSDEFLTTMFALKVAGNPSNEATARQAIAIIANHRKSSSLKQWLETGELHPSEMDASQAYARLDITDRTIDDEMILTVYKVQTDDVPSQADELRKALTAIAKARDSKTLLEYAGVGNDGSRYPLDEWPVALGNIGNTCYLNSLLQFYFSIRPFRELVLEIERFKTPLDDEIIRSKRIGGRVVTRREVERAQRTAEELRKLFKTLIESPRRSIRPDTEVARLTLLTPKAEIARRQSIRQSQNNAERPSFASGIGNINGVVIQGPSWPTQSQGLSNETVVIEGTSKDMDIQPSENRDQANSSSETLVDAPLTTADDMDVDESLKDQHELMLETKDNQSLEKATISTAAATHSTLEPLSETSPSRLNEKRPAPSSGLEDEAPQLAETVEGLPSTQAMHPPSSLPPPVPPRPKPSLDPDEAVKEAEFAAQQQDVNEIAYNILNQMQCAIKPEDRDEEGEQLDQIKSLFYGKQKTFITSQSGKVRMKEEFMSDIKVNVSAGPQDIYTALDGAFDVEDVVVAGGIEPKYYTISRLPPVLQIHIQRGQYDPHTKKEFKSDNHLELREMIYMDRYMDSSDPDILRRRQESWRWKRQLNTLEARWDQLIASDVGNAQSPAVVPLLTPIAAYGHVRGP